MVTFSIAIGAEPRLLRSKSCSTTSPDMTSPNSKRVSEKTAWGPLEGEIDDAWPCSTLSNACGRPGAPCGEAEKAKREDKARKTTLLVTRKTTKTLLVSYRRSRGSSRPPRSLLCAASDSTSSSRSEAARACCHYCRNPRRSSETHLERAPRSEGWRCPRATSMDP